MFQQEPNMISQKKLNQFLWKNGGMYWVAIHKNINGWKVAKKQNPALKKLWKACKIISHAIQDFCNC